ncbi:MAG: dual specificity protein phosphatase [Anaerolineales bacterium]
MPWPTDQTAFPRMRPLVSWITDQVAIAGAGITPETWPELQQLGFDAVVNLRSEYQDSFGEPFPKAYLWIPTEDYIDPQPQLLWLSAQFIDGAVKSGYKVLVHCKMGIYRSATTIVAYLIFTGLSEEEAIRKFAENGLRSYGSEENHKTLDAFVALLASKR